MANPTSDPPAIPVAAIVAAQEKTVEGQRRINLIWEVTQGLIALSITVAIIYCAFYKISSQELTNSFFLIIGFYFSRTNHQAIGGIGGKPIQPYEGR